MELEAFSVATFEAPYPADVLLFHPSEDTLVVGTYLLDEETRKRHGKISVLQLDADKGLQVRSEVDVDAVLDLKWYQERLYAAHSTGSLSVLADPDGHLQVQQNETVLDSNVLIMSLSVSDAGLLTSNSDGTVTLFDHEMRLKTSVQVSSLEAWIQAYNHPSLDANTIYAGADDGTLNVIDLRSGDIVLCNRKSHQAGVTAILPCDQETLLTGSYDDHIRSFDLRNLRRPVLEQNLGGGVWRIIPDRKKNTFLACCMYDGAKLVERTAEGFAITARHTLHESIVYGGDVRIRGDETLYGTCSFYDKRICLWTV